MVYIIIGCALLLLLILGFLEYRGHGKRLTSIPIRIHVNGTRGKSTVVRLVAGAIREAGIRTVARTTGTAARHILWDGSEIPIYRTGRPRIIEYVDTVKLAARNRAEALVVECMALHPAYQKITEQRLLRSTHGIITNVRSDHLDVMGPELSDAAKALCGTVPNGGVVITAEKKFLHVIGEQAEKRESRVVSSDGNEMTFNKPKAGSAVSVFKENYAIALALCRELGIKEDTALRGMEKAGADPGAATIHKMLIAGCEISAVNAFAGNDPESTELIISNLQAEGFVSKEPFIFLYNHRYDRDSRSIEFAGFFLNRCTSGGLERVIIIGKDSFPIYRRFIRTGIPKDRIRRLPASRSPEEIMETVIRDTGVQAGGSNTVIGVGNIGGAGMALLEYWNTIGTVHA